MPRVMICAPPLAVVLFLWGGIPQAKSDEVTPPLIRVDSFLVSPSSLPPVVVHVHNPRPLELAAAIVPSLPESWVIEPAEQDVKVAPGETVKVVFTTKRGRTVRDNQYSVRVDLREPSGSVTSHEQMVQCASAPYFRPEIDGDVEDWDDSIPVRFVTEGKSTVIGTFWNRRQFSLLVRIEEDELRRVKSFDTVDGGGDAIQFAIADRDAKTPTTNEPCSRFEFLVLPTVGENAAMCYLLARPDSEGNRKPVLAEGAVAAVARHGNETVYECSIPFRMLHTIRPSEGREFQFSVLAHDGDGVGLRDWGQAAGLWPSQHTAFGWTRWNGGSWGNSLPFDSKTAWGMCSSKY